MADPAAPRGAKFWIAFAVTVILVGGGAVALVVWGVSKVM